MIDEEQKLQLECLASYIAELSLLEYSMICYATSLIAASAIFLAKFILLPSERPWDSTLRHYTLYEPSDLVDCVNDLHRLFCANRDSTLPAVREKYSLHKVFQFADKYREALSNGRLKRTVSPFYYSCYGYQGKRTLSIQRSLIKHIDGNNGVTLYLACSAVSTNAQVCACACA